VKRRVRKGIPDAVRREAWALLANLKAEMETEPTMYKQLVERTDIPDQEIWDTVER
jgi:hypothetical protein